MIRINLLPYRERRKKEILQRQIAIFGFLSAIFIAGLISFNLILNGRISAAQATVETTKKEIANYNLINKEIEEIIKKLDILKKKTIVIESLQEERKKPLELVDTMTKVIIPKRMWFTSLTSNKESVSIDGIALDNKTVADFMTSLETTNLFTAVNLKSIRQETIKERNLNLKRFEIVCNKISDQEKSEQSKAKK
jgi:type IV pilus assembly protein PilN